jgi:D-inositol-3-phosphate glycosyltransferase
LSVQKAMASGLALVVSDDPGYDIYEFDRERVALVRRDVESVSAALEHIAADAQIRGGMARYSYELSASRFSWMTHACVLDNVYRDVLSRREGDRWIFHVARSQEPFSERFSPTPR